MLDCSPSCSRQMFSDSAITHSVSWSVSQSICCPQRGQHKMMSAAYRQRKACRGIVQLIQNRAEGRRWGCYVWTEQWPGQNSKLQVRTHAVQVCGRGAAQWTPNFLAVQQPSGPNGTQLDPLSKPSTPPRRWHASLGAGHTWIFRGLLGRAGSLSVPQYFVIAGAPGHVCT